MRPEHDSHDKQLRSTLSVTGQASPINIPEDREHVRNILALGYTAMYSILEVWRTGQLKPDLGRVWSQWTGSDFR
jgi:hypothetical protein